MPTGICHGRTADGKSDRRVSAFASLKVAVDVEPLLRRSDVCRRLSVSDRTLSRLICYGEVPKPDIAIGKRIVRWKASTIESFISAGGKP